MILLSILSVVVAATIGVTVGYYGCALIVRKSR